MKKLLPLTAFAFLALALPAQGEIYRAKFGSSKLTIYGDSTIHKWKVETKVLGGYLSLNADALAEPGAVAAKGKVIVPVRQLKSGKKRMDAIMHRIEVLSRTCSRVEQDIYREGVMLETFLESLDALPEEVPGSEAPNGGDTVDDSETAFGTCCPGGAQDTADSSSSDDDDE